MVLKVFQTILQFFALLIAESFFQHEITHYENIYSFKFYIRVLITLLMVLRKSSILLMTFKKIILTHRLLKINDCLNV